MACCIQDIETCIVRGTGWGWQFTFLQADGISVADLSGYDFKLTIRATTSGTGTPAFTLTVGSGITVTTATGVVLASLIGTQTDDLTAGTTYYADLLVTPPTGQPYSVPQRAVISVVTPNTMP